MKSCAAISWFVAPSAARRATSASWGGEVVTRLDAALAGVLAGRLELDARALGKRLHAELAKQLMGGPQLLAGVEPAALAA